MYVTVIHNLFAVFVIGTRGSRRARLSIAPIGEMANDNFSASSHLIYDVPLMEETCGDSRISTGDRPKEESTGLFTGKRENRLACNARVLAARISTRRTFRSIERFPFLERFPRSDDRYSQLPFVTLRFDHEPLAELRCNRAHRWWAGSTLRLTCVSVRSSL